MSKFSSPQLLQTADGSSTLYHAELDETYHSKHGAIQESQHVFIKNGLEYFLYNQQKEEINILEIGLGTGLNAMLTFLSATNISRRINYYALEAYPPPQSVISQLNYSEILAENIVQSIFSQIHICEWEKMIPLRNNFNFIKHKIKLQEFTAVQYFDVVYFDAFSPQIQPELWTQEIFEKLYKMMAENALLVTYCAKGEVRRNMQQAGFLVERLPGPPGKREILRARKTKP